jgi:putative transposase
VDLGRLFRSLQNDLLRSDATDPDSDTLRGVFLVIISRVEESQIGQPLDHDIKVTNSWPELRIADGVIEGSCRNRRSRWLICSPHREMWVRLMSFGVVEDDGIVPMAHTYTNLLTHVVFSTQGRARQLTKERRAELFAYIAALFREKGVRVLIVNGVDDHVHILIELPSTVALSDVMRFVKANSSRWFTERFEQPFAWQKGFGAFSVSRSSFDVVFNYIRDQEMHHRSRDFREEFLAMLRKSGVEHDPEYLWK